MKSKIMHIAFVGILLTSCGAYRQYQPVNAVPDNLYGIEYSGTDTASLASIGWKDFFNDDCLKSLIDTALVRNTDYNIAQLRVEQALATLGCIRLSYLPSLGLSLEGGTSRSGRVYSNTYNVTMNASWEVDIFGRLTAAKRGAAVAAVSADEEAQAVKTQLIAAVASSYYALLLLDRQIEIANMTLGNWTETIRVMELLKTAGLANEAGILQAKANKVGLQAEVAEMEKNAKEIENSLCSMLAMLPCKIDRGVWPEALPAHDLSLGLPIELLARRPDVRAVEMELARTHYVVGEARASFYPSLTLEGAVGLTNNGGVVANPGQWLLNAVGQLIQPIFNRGKLKTNYKIAEAEREIARLRFSQALLDAAKEVNDALANIHSARKRLMLAQEQTALLTDAVKKTELMMRHSPTNYLEVLTAQQTLLAAQQTEVQCRYEEIVAIISLYHALGGGK